MLARAVVVAGLATLAAAQASGRAEGEGFGRQTWLSRCLADTTGKCMTDVTTAQFLDPANTGAAGALSALSSGPDHHPYATYPFRSNDGLRSAETGYDSKFRGRMHSSSGIPHSGTSAQPIYGRGGTNQLPENQVAATGGADGGFNHFNQGGSFTTLDSMFQRPTASFPDDREKVLAGENEYSVREHGLFRCTVDAETAWTATQIEIDTVKYNPPLQGTSSASAVFPPFELSWALIACICVHMRASAGGSARFMMQTVDFAEGTNCA